MDFVNHDSVIALYDYVPASVTNPIVLGALRASDAASVWQDDVVKAFARGARAVLSGDIQNLESIIEDLRILKSQFENSRVALLIHWSQALSSEPPDKLRETFEKIYVAIDRELSQGELQLMRHRWGAEWILVPTGGINWQKWISENLIPSRRGRITVLAPRDESKLGARRYLTADELALMIEALSVTHPLLQIQAAPPGWFVPSELGPWLGAQRDYSALSLRHDSRNESAYSLSVIIPFRWTGDETTLRRLTTSIDSVSQACKATKHEIVVIVDRDEAVSPLTAANFKAGIANFVLGEHVRTSDGEDWRAGFIRNCGAQLSHPSSDTFLFLDADASLMEDAGVQLSFADSDADFYFSDFRERDCGPPVLMVRRELYARIGGFADAFTSYGGEASFCIWLAKASGARIEKFDGSIVRSLREPIDAEDLVFKIKRLQPSTNLMFRMTLDLDVHARYYQSIDSGVWIRTIAKRFVVSPYARPFFGFIVFVLTLTGTEDRSAYLRGFYEGALWKLRRPLLWLRSGAHDA